MELFLLVEINKGMVNGWYSSLKGALGSQNSLNARFPDESWHVLQTPKGVSGFNLNRGENAIADMYHNDVRGEKEKNTDLEPKKEDMTLRDWFAGMALAGMLASPKENLDIGVNHLSSQAYDYAADMIREREE